MVATAMHSTTPQELYDSPAIYHRSYDISDGLYRVVAVYSFRLVERRQGHCVLS
ncbi:hypothetical protein TSAR_016663 [Trichomalopsis sarcophagae]|uniref:Uncharacterized protein n=1 Tax=Trichomalopsis sarcophagae TaxID=543379 RepID=A0A232FCX0_9HYME|nr:hypothetical protein TSAR_016663 [Trichomalopsis sarcophagae]